MMARYNSAYSNNNHWFARRGSIAAIIIGFLLLVCAVGGYLAYKSISTRLNSGRPHSKQESKTIYASAEKKHEQLKRIVSQANIATRNFPLSPEELKKKTGIRDGGEVYLFGTTHREKGNVLIRCHKIDHRN